MLYVPIWYPGNLPLYAKILLTLLVLIWTFACDTILYNIGIGKYIYCMDKMNMLEYVMSADPSKPDETIYTAKIAGKIDME